MRDGVSLVWRSHDNTTDSGQLFDQDAPIEESGAEDKTVATDGSSLSRVRELLDIKRALQVASHYPPHPEVCNNFLLGWQCHRCARMCPISGRDKLCGVWAAYCQDFQPRSVTTQYVTLAKITQPRHLAVNNLDPIDLPDYTEATEKSLALQRTIDAYYQQLTPGGEPQYRSETTLLLSTEQRADTVLKEERSSPPAYEMAPLRLISFGKPPCRLAISIMT